MTDDKLGRWICHLGSVICHPNELEASSGNPSAKPSASPALLRSYADTLALHATPYIPGLTSVPETNEMAQKEILQVWPTSASNPYEYPRTISEHI
jgi:hypothetical protein